MVCCVSDLGLAEREQRLDFIHRHIGPSPRKIQEMLDFLGIDSLDDLARKTIPPGILSDRPLNLPESRTEKEVIEQLHTLACRNRIRKSMIGLGYSGCFTPAVLLRNVLENPAWYTAYTPYQAEISQGRLEALLNFQTMVTELTAMEIANASLLDEATAAAEAMSMSLSLQSRSGRRAFWISEQCHPQTIEVVKTRARPLGVTVSVGDHKTLSFEGSFFGICLQYPTSQGAIHNYAELIERAHADRTQVVVAADLLSLTLLQPPGEFGADVVVGSSQRFGVPLGFGGPHAAFFATRSNFKRSIPGRIVGVSQDARGQAALRLALQTREQHIRREKATSNICTAQVLPAVLAAMYAVYHGPEGLKRIARRIHLLACLLAAGLEKLGYALKYPSFFDTLAVQVRPGQAGTLSSRATRCGINLRVIDSETLGVSLDETSSRRDVEVLWEVFRGEGECPLSIQELETRLTPSLPSDLKRTTDCLTQPVFNRYHSETEMLRYLHRLQEKDLSLTTSMIPLGSCTMKLNATSEMLPMTFGGFADVHPFVPLDQVEGYLELIRQLEGMLSEITGFAGVSLQPNAGSQGELTGMLMIRKYHETRGQERRRVCLIPSSAHGTNPASATMAGMKVVVVGCDGRGNIDIDDLRTKAGAHRQDLAALMVTYPSTHGVFEAGITRICDIVHDHGGQVYLDGANLNALVGLCRPAELGADVAHLNLHKTFCIPHGGGGPGVGPIGVKEHLLPFLPSHPLLPEAGPKTGISAVAAAPWGSAGILPISWAFISLMGRNGLKKATQTAILNANYLAARLSDHYAILFTGLNGLVAHECIVDVRPLRKSAGVDVADLAKRLMDYGFHAPTMSWPVAGTLMIEPTESESKEELDRFCEAMISIRGEVRQIEEGRMDPQNNPLKNAPHTWDDLLRQDWDRPYSRQEGAFPLPWVRRHKFWPSVGRIDDAFGDRHLVCNCPTP
ncbi:MAG: aminomethyl-transferring glycine dehydrogenase [Acidobacteriota bacterium]